jgi:hypothetical protein
VRRSPGESGRATSIKATAEFLEACQARIAIARAIRMRKWLQVWLDLCGPELPIK